MVVISGAGMTKSSPMSLCAKSFKTFFQEGGSGIRRDADGDQPSDQIVGAVLR
jgi:hypothetical protein